MTSSFNFPAYAVLAVWADEAVAILLGTQWQDAGYFMRIFAIWGMIRSTGNPVGSLLYAAGHVRRAFWWNLMLLLLIPLILWCGANQAGVKGLAWAMLGIQLSIFYPAFRYLVHPACGANFREYFGALFPPLVATACAVILGLAASSWFPHEFWIRISIGAIVTAAAYLVASSMINKPWISTMSELLSPILRRLG